MSTRRIGQIFVDMGFITDEQLQLLLEEQQQQPGALLGKLAEDMTLITDEQLAQALGEQMNMKVVSLGDAPIAPELLEKLTETMAQLYRVIPVRFDGHRLTVATCDPQNLSIQDELRTFLGFDIEMVVATEREIKATIERFYSSDSLSVEKIVKELAEDTELFKQASMLTGDKFSLDGAEALADSAPVRKLLNLVLLLAIKDHASDIHFEPFEAEFRIRIKAEGVLYEMVPPPRHLAFAITTRIKVMANLAELELSFATRVDRSSDCKRCGSSPCFGRHHRHVVCGNGSVGRTCSQSWGDSTCDFHPLLLPRWTNRIDRLHRKPRSRASAAVGPIQHA